MPATIQQLSPQLIGANHQELVNQLALVIRPHLKIAFDFTTADATVLTTIPSFLNGASGLQVEELFWEVTNSFTGGTGSAIGVSSSNASYNTKGDLLGGASGDVAANLTSTGKYKGGTLGTKFASKGKVILLPGDTIRFDRITSAFTAGSGYVHVNFSYVD